MDITYKLFKSPKRKTVAVQIKNGEVIVRAPVYVSDAYINDIVSTKSSWIKNKVALFKQRPAVVTPSCFAQGDAIWFLGKPYQLQYHFTSDKALIAEEQVLLSEQKLIVYLAMRYQNKPSEQQKIAARKQLELFYKTQTHYYLDEHLPLFVALTRLTPINYQVRRYKARWGSCNSKKELSFNCLLMMVPSFVFDYVIIHELCHIQHLNHSAQFWQLVAAYCPAYKDAKAWLKKHQHELVWH